MAMRDESYIRYQLLRFLDRQVFDPVLSTDVNAYPRQKQDQVKGTQEAVAQVKHRYHSYYSTPEEIKNYFKRDLNSSSYRETGKQLRNLNLPSFEDVKYEFQKLLDQLGVEPE